MKALELVGPSTLELVERPDPVPGGREVLVRVKACGICGSDIHGMDGNVPSIPCPRGRSWMKPL